MNLPSASSRAKRGNFHFSQGCHDRLGRRKQVTDDAGTRAFAYDATTLQPTTETFTAGMFSGKRVTQVYQDGTGGTLAGRFGGVQVGTVLDPDAYYAAAYAYDAYGRLDHVTGPGLPSGAGTTNGAWYDYRSDSPLIDKLTFKDNSDNVKGWTQWSYDADRDLVTSVQNNWGTTGTYTTISQYGYGHDSLAQRTHKQRSGIAFSSSFYEVYDYDDRLELEDSEYYTGTYDTGTSVPASDQAYTYDPIGNRLTWASGALPTIDYTANATNQYTLSQLPTTPPVYQSHEYDQDGNLTQKWAAGDMNCDGMVNVADSTAMTDAIQGQAYYEARYPDCNWLNGDINGDLNVDLGDINPFVSLVGTGNNAVSLTLEYDAENRLILVEPTQGLYEDPPDGAKKAAFVYDYLGRRIEKKVWTWDAGEEKWDLTAHRKFVYQGWLAVLELDGLDSDAVLRQYTWGLDIGSNGQPMGLAGSGGIGGLLAVHDEDESDDYVYFYDGSGNVGQVVDLFAASASVSMMAKYEYDPYGRIVSQTGDYAEDQPFRFSTKYYDGETDLSYFGHRYYDASLGRWTNRDPIGEAGGVNVYNYVGNNPLNRVDYLGLNMCHIDWPRCGGPGLEWDHSSSSDDDCAASVGIGEIGRLC